MKKHVRIWCLNIFVVLVMASAFAACGNASINANAALGPTGRTTTFNSSIKSTNTSSSSAPLKVTNVDISVSPSSLSNYACGTTLTETYTATFHFPAANAGGQVKFEYTTNNGRSSAEDSLVVQPGQRTETYTFRWSGQLDSSHTVPGAGGVLVSSPNAYISPLVAPAGACLIATSVPFNVDSIGLSASPALTGHSCGSFFTEIYTAVFHIAAGSPGGTIVFQYTTTNGRSSSPNVSLPVAAGQTSATYTFSWSGTLPASHTVPGVGIVMTSAPNQVISSSAAPVGMCS